MEESSYSGMSWGLRSEQSGGMSSGGGLDEERMTRRAEEVTDLIRKLREISHNHLDGGSGKGKGKAKEIDGGREDEAWDTLNALASIFKHLPGLRYSVKVDLIIDR